MTDPKDSEGFFRKVVRFVANPATDWTHLNQGSEARHGELERSEIKAMIERKRRNDFVRKREFDMLRKLRREGLSAEQLAALGVSSRLDDSESRVSELIAARPQSHGVKAKIDEIELQMVGNAHHARPRYSRPTPLDAVTQPAVLSRLPALVSDDELLPALPPLPNGEPAAPTRSMAAMAAGLSPLAPMHMAASTDIHSLRNGVDVEVAEVIHDPELDEAVISFANADFTQCEQSLLRLIRTGGSRVQHAETWLVLFDLYRATGQQQPFENLASEYAHEFGWSAPQWFSLPALVAAATAADERPKRSKAHADANWICPPELDVNAVARLRSQTLQMPLPWVFEFGPLCSMDADAAAQLSALFRTWAPQAIHMRWLSGQRLLDVMHEAAPTGVRDAAPAYWQARLDALRLCNRPDQFDEVAIDYCVTYEVSPPSWEPTRCKVDISSGSGLSAFSVQPTVQSELPMPFLESGLHENAISHVQTAHVELSGQLMGDLSTVLNRLNGELGQATVVNVSCSKLIRVDFIAAGDLLNWVLARRAERRTVMFTEAHRLVALFYGAMGINEHAKVQVRKV